MYRWYCLYFVAEASTVRPYSCDSAISSDSVEYSDDDIGTAKLQQINAPGVLSDLIPWCYPNDDSCNCVFSLLFLPPTCTSNEGFLRPRIVLHPWKDVCTRLCRGNVTT
ncbi:hypothetical protein A0H81_00519 [Grifola frondosa]|uniref:Uncharacterized protein n=1 Tax=Grifola frondosa TaxID=5627 RepID=A0A1C7MR97_GRIFR|nr:hypothetical protein A0H81_00519 [Grifola frondosa]